MAGLLDRRSRRSKEIDRSPWPWHWLFRTPLDAKYLIAGPSLMECPSPNVCNSEHAHWRSNERLRRSHVKAEVYAGVPLVLELARVEFGLGNLGATGPFI